MPRDRERYVFRQGLRFEKTPEGLVFCPEPAKGEKKYPCPDCRSCSFCAETRCSVCRGRKPEE